MLDVIKKIKYNAYMIYELLFDFAMGFGLLTLCVWIAYLASIMFGD